MSYLTQPNPGFGPLAWVFFISQVVLLLVGSYFAFFRRDANPVRASALKQLGYALVALGAVGTLLGGLRLGAVEPFTTRLWFAITALFEVVLGLVALAYSRRVYPEQLRAYQATRPQRRAVPTQQRKPVPARPSRPVQPVEVGDAHGAAARRETRRDRRRRKK